jgi:hypothetical protein
MPNIHSPLSRRTRLCARLAAFLLCLLSPAFCTAQNLGQLVCAHPGSYISLYSSMLTLDVQDTLACGQQVEVTGRYDNYFGIRTAKGEIGYVTLDSLSLLKTTPGVKPTLTPAPEPASEKTPVGTHSNAPDSSKTLILLDSTPVQMTLSKALSSADAQVGDDVSFEVSQEVVIDGLLIIPKGAIALGVVNECEPKKPLGRGGKLSVLVRSVRLADNEQGILRSGGEGKGSSSTAGVLIPVMRGKDITFPKGMEFTAYVNGDARLKRENFHPAPENPDGVPTGRVSNLPHP